tara:strand:- start:2324 stop:3451 length:1128 start_codon:yes stop_codon:yes gene_type:complete
MDDNRKKEPNQEGLPFIIMMNLISGYMLIKKINTDNVIVILSILLIILVLTTKLIKYCGKMKVKNNWPRSLPYPIGFLYIFFLILHIIALFTSSTNNLILNYILFILSFYVILKIFKSKFKYPFLILLLFSIISYFCYSVLFVSLDKNTWNRNKCKTRYMFNSGFIKQNPDRSMYDSTEDNFYKCITENLPVDEIKENIDTKMKQIEENTQQIVKDKNKKYDNMVNTNYYSTLNQLNSVSILINNKQTNNNNTLNLAKNEITQLVTLLNNIKNYGHSYLTYIVGNFAIKYKMQSKYDTDNGPGEEQVETDCTNNSFDKSNYETKFPDVDKWEDISGNFCALDPDTNSYMSKSSFFKNQAIKYNDVVTKYFGGNKF